MRNLFLSLILSNVYNAECYQDSEYKNLEIYYGA